MRIELPDGQWAELRERITHGQDKAIKRALLRAKANETEAFESTTVIIRQFVRAWYINDPDGAVIPFEDVDAADRLPDDIADTIFDAAMDLYKASTRPNPPTPPSSDGSPSPAVG